MLVHPGNTCCLLICSDALITRSSYSVLTTVAVDLYTCVSTSDTLQCTLGHTIVCWSSYCVRSGYLLTKAYKRLNNLHYNMWA